MIVFTPAQVGAIDQPASRRVQFSHEGISYASTAIPPVESTRRCGKVGGLRIAGDVRSARRIHSDSVAALVVDASEEGTVYEVTAFGVEHCDIGILVATQPVIIHDTVK